MSDKVKANRCQILCELMYDGVAIDPKVGTQIRLTFEGK